MPGSVLRSETYNGRKVRAIGGKRPYPRLTREDIQAALGYAADSLAHKTIIQI
jgi:hypothetical protein